MDSLDNRLLSFLSTIHRISATAKRVHGVDAAASSDVGMMCSAILLNLFMKHSKHAADGAHGRVLPAVREHDILTLDHLGAHVWYQAAQVMNTQTMMHACVVDPGACAIRHRLHARRSNPDRVHPHQAVLLDVWHGSGVVFCAQPSASLCAGTMGARVVKGQYIVLSHGGRCLCAPSASC